MASYSRLPVSPNKTPVAFSYGQLRPPNVAGPPNLALRQNRRRPDRQFNSCLLLHVTGIRGWLACIGLRAGFGVNCLLELAVVTALTGHVAT